MNMSEHNSQGADASSGGFRGGRGGAGGRGRGGQGMGGSGVGHRGMRAGRMLGQGDLKLLALALIAELPRHGYDIIKVVEEATGGNYAPSSSLVYPTLTLLEELGHLRSQSEGSKKLYVITDEGQAHLAANRTVADVAFKRLAAYRKRGSLPCRHHRDAEPNEVEHAGLPALMRAALDNLSDVAGKRILQDPATEAELVAIVARAAGELRKV